MSSVILRCGTSLVMGLTAGALCGAEPEVDAKQLPRVPPTEPANALATFRVRPGFRVELAVAEPLVVSPVAMSFDEDGRLYVVEMRDYSERRPERLGRVRRLEDADGDGRFEKSVVFAEDLPWPTAVICWAGGVFVGATPDILYFKDTDGDGKADVRETVFTGFGSDYAPFATNKLNVQALMNSFNWGLDNRIHGATSFSGGRVKRVDTPFTRQWLERAGVPPRSPNHSPQSLELRGRDFSFDPRTLEMRTESGGGQHGMSFDNRGRKFVCSNSDHIQLIMYEDRYASRHPYFSMPSPRVSIAADGPAAEVFRLSPEEPWRVLRTQWRVSGLVPGPIEGGGRSSGYFTGATGVTIYRGDAFGEEFVGDAFIGDAGSNLIHRKKLRSDGLLLRAERPADEQKVEFLASTDNWFRPVQFANGPDGCLYVADMYREVIEHPWSLPANLKKHLDLNSGNDRGRIYRIVPEKFQRPNPPHLSRARIEELVLWLDQPNGWLRDTASRLLCERRDKSAVLPLMHGSVSSKSPLGRVHALRTLESLGALNEVTVQAALEDKSPIVQVEALKLSERFLTAPSEPLWSRLSAVSISFDHTAPLGADNTAQYQLAFTLGETKRPDRLKVLVEVLRRRLPTRSMSAWLEAAILSSVGDDAGEMFSRLYESRPSLQQDEEFLLQLVGVVGSVKKRTEIDRVLEFAIRQRNAGDVTRGNPLLDIAIVSRLGQGLEQGGGSLRDFADLTKLNPLVSRAWDVARTGASAGPGRLQAISLLGMIGDTNATGMLVGLLDARQPRPVQTAALHGLERLGGPQFVGELMSRWASLSPVLRNDVIALLLKRPERVRALLNAVVEGAVRPSDIAIEQQALLRSQRDLELRDLAMKALGQPPEVLRQSIVELMAPALKLKGDGANGRKLFLERCATCHKLGSEGHTLGPDLATVKSGGREKVLIAILDPNREVAPNFASYTVETKDGESLWDPLESTCRHASLSIL